MQNPFRFINRFFRLKKFRSSLYPGLTVTNNDCTRPYIVVSIRDEYDILKSADNKNSCHSIDTIYPINY